MITSAMSTHFTPPPNSTNKCDICKEEIPFFQAVKNKDRDLNICGAIECENVLKQRSRMPPSAFAQYLKSHQQVIEQRKQRIKIQKQLKDKEFKVNQLIFKSVVGQCDNPENKPEHLVVLPTGHSRMEPIPIERVDKYIEHLKAVIQQALSYNNVNEVPQDNNHEAHQRLIEKEKRFASQPKLKKISDQLCMICKGGCCPRGENHAYITASSIRRLLDENPDYTGESLLSEYVSHIGDKSIAHACINQTNTGCALPRWLRSSTCNQFHCSSISQYHKKIESDDQIKPLVVIQRKHSLWDRAYSSEPNAVTKIAILSDEDCKPVDSEWVEV